MQGPELQQIIMDKIIDAKGTDVLALDVRNKSSITDTMIICTGTSSRHVSSIADKVFQSSRRAGVIPLSVSGEQDAEWIIVDLGDLIVHIMQQESRLLYQLEKLWS